MWPFIVLGVCVPVRESLCLLWHKTHTLGLMARPPARLEVDKERKVPEKIEGQLTKEDGERQSTMVGRRDQSARDSSPGEGLSAEGGSEGRQSKMSWHSYWLLKQFHTK